MKDYIRVNQKAYNVAAEEYAERSGEYEDRDKELIAPFVDYLKNSFQHARVLELGPGSGLALKIFTANGFETTAIEVAEKIIDVARQVSPNTDFIHDDFLSHNFNKQVFDGVFAKAFIHLFPKQDAIEVLNKIHSLMPAGGALFLATTVHESSSEGFEEKTDYDTSPVRFRKKWTSDELHQALANKWEIIEENYNEERNKTWLALTLIKRTQ